MKAVIMAGGEGTRLRPLTCNRPKPMVSIANKPVMEHIIELLKKHKITDVAVTLQYLPGLIKEYFNDGSEFGVKMEYFVEEMPLGTAGSVKNAEEFLDDTFIVISGDALTDINLSEAIEFHKNKNSIATLVLKRVDTPLEYGVVVTDEIGKITRFLEKPGWSEVFSDTVNTGIYILSPVVLKYFEKNKVFDFSKDLFPMLLKENMPIYGFVTEDYWCDIGDLKAYSQAQIDVLERKVKVNIPGKEVREGVWIDEGVLLKENVSIEAPCVIGKNTIVNKDSTIGSYSIIGEYNMIGERCGIKRSIIGKNSIIDSNSQIRGSLLCDKVHINKGTSTFEYAVVGDETEVGENVVIKPGVKIWPNKTVDDTSCVSSNIVWGSKFMRSVFGNRGILGRVNIDFTPEFASKLGASFSAMFKGNTKISLSCDDSNQAQMLKMSFIAGVLSTGCEVFDFDKLLLPMTRSAIRLYRLAGGIHISTSNVDKSKLYVDFLNKHGSNINRDIERKIETNFFREDFVRCEGNAINDIKKISDYKKFYLMNILSNIKSKNMDFKVAINTTSGFTGDTMLELLSELGCEVEITHFEAKMKNCDKDETIDVEEFSRYVVNGGFDLGASIDELAEKMILVDNKGKAIYDDSFLALISIILFKTLKNANIVIPISSSHVIEKIAEENNGTVQRTKTAPRDVMNKMTESEIAEDMLEQFTMNFDAIASLIKIMDFIKINNLKLSDLVERIPEFYMNKTQVKCPWSAKGKVIREFIQQNCGKNIETIEGVKIHQENGWVLILPDSQQPVCSVISESSSAEFAKELSDIYVNMVQEISCR